MAQNKRPYWPSRFKLAGVCCRIRAPWVFTVGSFLINRYDQKRQLVCRSNLHFDKKAEADLRQIKTKQSRITNRSIKENAFTNRQMSTLFHHFCLRFHLCFFQFRIEKTEPKEDFIWLRLYNSRCGHSELIHFVSPVHLRPFESLLCYPFVRLPRLTGSLEVKYVETCILSSKTDASKAFTETRARWPSPSLQPVH